MVERGSGNGGRGWQAGVAAAASELGYECCATPCASPLTWIVRVPHAWGAGGRRGG